MTEKDLRQKIAFTARTHLGTYQGDEDHKEILDIYNNHEPLARGYKVKTSDSWCATFVSAVFIESCMAELIETECSCQKMIDANKDIWVEDDTYIPDVGDIVMYDWDDDGDGDCTGWADHVGIVTSVNGYTFEIVEGNKNKSVGVRTLIANAKFIRGFITPDYASIAEEVDTLTVGSVEDIAKAVLRGEFGNGEERKVKLEAMGYNYSEVQAKVNELLSDAIPKPEEKSIDEIVWEVIRGEWGNGTERKQKLTQAGYNYDAIQKKVNEIL